MSSHIISLEYSVKCYFIRKLLKLIEIKNRNSLKDLFYFLCVFFFFTVLILNRQITNRSYSGDTEINKKKGNILGYCAIYLHMHIYFPFYTKSQTSLLFLFFFLFCVTLFLVCCTIYCYLITGVGACTCLRMRSCAFSNSQANKFASRTFIGYFTINCKYFHYRITTCTSVSKTT